MLYSFLRSISAAILRLKKSVSSKQYVIGKLSDKKSAHIIVNTPHSFLHRPRLLPATQGSQIVITGSSKIISYLEDRYQVAATKAKVTLTDSCSTLGYSGISVYSAISCIAVASICLAVATAVFATFTAVTAFLISFVNLTISLTSS